MTTPLTLQVGKCYIRRDAQITGPLEETPDDDTYTFQCPKTNETWTPSGIHILGTQYHPRDLILECLPQPATPPEKAGTDKVGTGLTLIPWYSILAIGSIFIEGLRYGRDNWKKGVNDKEYQEERLEHAMLHLLKWKEGDRTEAHLAKVAWFCVTQLELERMENEVSSPTPQKTT